MRTEDRTATPAVDITDMVRRLEAARGDAHELALVTLDIVMASEDAALREALEAAAVPHWFHAELLRELLEIDGDAAAALMEQLAKLSVVEPFQAHSGWNVHEATRLGLRKRLLREQPARFAALSGRAAALFAEDTPKDRVERLYHRLSATPAEAIDELSDVWVEWDRASRLEPLQALGTVLSELIRTDALTPLARGRALVVLGQIRSSRMSISELEAAAREAASLMRETGDDLGLSDAQHMLARALVNRGRLNEAIPLFDETRAILERQLAARPDDAQRLSDLANLRSDLGGVWRARGNFEKAQAEIAASVAILRRLVEREPVSTRWKYELSVTCVLAGQQLMDSGDLPHALRELREATRLLEELLAAQPDSPDWDRELAVARNSVGVVLRLQGDMRGAAREFEASRLTMERLARLDPEHATWRRDLQVAHSLLGSMLLFQGRLEAAVEEYRSGLQIAHELVQLDPDNAGFWDNLAGAHSDLGSAYLDLGSLEEALKHHSAAKAIAHDLVGDEPENGARRSTLASAHSRVGGVLEGMGRSGDALAEYEAARRIMLDLTATEPDSIYWQGQLAACHNELGGALITQGRQAEALAEYEAARAIRLRQIERDPDNTAWRMGLAVSHRLVGRVHKAESRFAEALESCRASKLIIEALVARDPDNTDWLRQLSIAHADLGSVLMRLSSLVRTHPDVEPAQQEAVLSQAVIELAAARDAMVRLTEVDPDNGSWRFALATSHTDVGEAFGAIADWIEQHGSKLQLPPSAEIRQRSLESYEAARAILSGLVEQDPVNTGWQRSLSIAHYRIGQALDAAGRKEDALASYEADLAIAERLAQLDPSNARWQEDLATTRTQLARFRATLDDATGSREDRPGTNGRA